MELRDYLSIRRAYNLVRQGVDPTRRLTFAEFAILCHLCIAGGVLKTSEIADYQQSLRPTMTHRTKHLASLGLIERSKGDVDRRNVVCGVTDEGRAYMDELCAYTADAISTSRSLSRINAERVSRYVDSMGVVPCMSGELVILGLYASESGASTVTELVHELGLLQPTVSMSVRSLEGSGHIMRPLDAEGFARSGIIMLAEKGKAVARALDAKVRDIVVRRRPRTH